jgi:hypothetical protein
VKKITSYKCEHCSTIYEDEDAAKNCEAVHSRKIVVRSADFSKGKAIPLAVEIEIHSKGAIDVIWYYK